MYHTWSSFALIVLKHLGDLPFQITTCSEIFEPSAARKKAPVRR